MESTFLLPLLLILPLAGAAVCALLPDAKLAKTWALIVTLVTAAVMALTAFLTALVAAISPEVEPRPDISEELARKGAIIFGFAMAANSLVSAVAAWWMGTMGGDHRDTSFDLSKYISFRVKKAKK